MTNPGGDGFGGPHDDLMAFLHSRDWSSLEELNEAIGRRTSASNRRPLDNFCGLSPDQMTALLYAPFNSPEVVRFPGELEEEPPSQVPVVALLRVLIDQIGPEATPLTAKGNFKLPLCRAALDAHRANCPTEGGYSVPRGDIRTEEDFDPLHRLHITLRLGGYLKKRKGRDHWSPEARRLLTDGLRSLLPALFETYVRNFNWGYSDRIEELPFIQQSFLFPLFLLGRFGDRWREADFFRDKYLTAFPAVLGEVVQGWSTPEDIVGLAVDSRVLDRMAWFFGLAEKKVIKRKGTVGWDAYYRAGPLLGKLVRFRV